MYWFTLGAQVNTLEHGVVCARFMAFDDCSRQAYVIDNLGLCAVLALSLLFHVS